MIELNASLLAEKNGRAKRFRKILSNSLSFSMPDLFEDAYEQYSKFLTNPELKLSPKDIHLELMKEIAQGLFWFFDEKKFKQEKVLDYLEVVEDIIPPKLFAFLLWSQDKKEACIKLLQNNQIDLSENEYDSLYLILMPHRANRNTPYHDEVKIEFLRKQKAEFFSYHDKCQLAHELTELPTHKSVSKKNKL